MIKTIQKHWKYIWKKKQKQKPYQATPLGPTCKHRSRRWHWASTSYGRSSSWDNKEPIPRPSDGTETQVANPERQRIPQSENPPKRPLTKIKIFKSKFPRNKQEKKDKKNRKSQNQDFHFISFLMGLIILIRPEEKLHNRTKLQPRGSEYEYPPRNFDREKRVSGLLERES